MKENVDYEILKADMKYQYELLDELVEIIVDVVAVHRKSIRIGGADYPYELVKGKFLKLDSGHIRYVLDSMEKTTTHISWKSSGSPFPGPRCQAPERQGRFRLCRS